MHKDIICRKVGLLLALTLIVFGCSKASAPLTELKHYPLDSLEGVVDASLVELDSAVAEGGVAALKVTADKPGSVRLLDVGDLDVEDARLVYRASVRTRDVAGKVYLEMWCGFAGRGEFFSRGLQSTLSGSAEWTMLETPFFLKKGENPDVLRLNLVIEGTGTVWIDDIRLLKGPLS